jgi:hypothetical protein
MRNTTHFQRPLVDSRDISLHIAVAGRAPAAHGAAENFAVTDEFSPAPRCC